MYDVKEKIKEFKNKYRNKCFALNAWKELHPRGFTLGDLLIFICGEAKGSIEEMSNIIDHLTQKPKIQGRTQVYGGGHNVVDIVRDDNGNMKLVGYNSEDKLQAKGQRVPRNPKIFRKSDGQVSRTYQKAESKMFDLGKEVKTLFPDETSSFIVNAMQAIRKYAADKKINVDKVVRGIQKGRYVIDTDTWRVVPKPRTESKQRKVVVINEEDISRLSDLIEMTEQKFHSNLRKFISQLLEDPVNAQPSDLFKMYGLNRCSLLKYLLQGKDPILFRSERISDKDENGEPKTATMMVKFKCPKKNFDRKLQKLFIKLFEKNLPQKQTNGKEEELNEDGEGGGATSAASSGQFSQPVFPMMRRKMPVEIEETTATTNTGNYQYTVPFGGDKETLARKNGVGGSVSINKA